jgi:hypothetical protein
MMRHFPRNIPATIASLSIAFAMVMQTSCETPPPNASSLSDAYTELFNAVKSKDTERIKTSMSKGTLSFAEFVSNKQGKSLEEVLQNGFTQTTFAENLPAMRDQQIKDGLGHLEVYNSKSGNWEVIPFVLEEGAWKAAFGDLFSGKWRSPGKPLSQVEAERDGGPMKLPQTDSLGTKPSTGFPIDPAIEKNLLRQPNPTLGPDATPGPAPNNPTLK